MDSLIEVTAFIFKEGDKISSETIPDGLWLKDFDNSVTEIGSVKKQDEWNPQDDLEFIGDNILFAFNIIGEGCGEGISSGMAAEFEGCSYDAFKDYREDLGKIALMKYEHYQKMAKPSDKKNTNNIVRFITVWNYYCHQDYWGEWDTETEFVGILDTSSIKTLTNEELDKRLKESEKKLTLNDVLEMK